MGQRRWLCRRVPDDLLTAPAGKEEAGCKARGGTRGPAHGSGEEVITSLHLITTLLDHQAPAPAGARPETVPDQVERRLRPRSARTRPDHRSRNARPGRCCDRGPAPWYLEAWAWMTAAQLTRASASARSAAMRAGPLPCAGRQGARSPPTRESSQPSGVTRSLHGHPLRVTESSSLDAIAAEEEAADRSAFAPSRPRPRAALPASPESPPETFAHTSSTKETVRRETPGHVFAPGFSRHTARNRNPSGRRNHPGIGTTGPWNRAPPRRGTRAKNMPRITAAQRKTDSKADTEHKTGNTKQATKPHQQSVGWHLGRYKRPKCKLRRLQAC